MSTYRFLLLIILISIANLLTAQQTYRVNAPGIPLNRAIIEFSHQYNLQFTFDDDILSRYNANCTGTFTSLNEVMSCLLKETDLQFEIWGELCVIFDAPVIKENTSIAFAARLVDAYDKSPLPYSHVLLDGISMVTNEQGYFSAELASISPVHLTLSHLGYYVLDTIINPQIYIEIQMFPSRIGLSEVIIENRRIDYSQHVGELPGVVKLNHQIANFLPGSGDNSVYNLLRLQPGVLAAGEQTNELMVWGNYPGQSQVFFDGYPIYGLKNFNDNISAFNPLLVKEMDLLKGAYSVKYGDRVGSILSITGKSGNTDKYSLTTVVNNMTMNTLVDIPVKKNQSLLLAFRHTYYNLYDPTVVSSIFHQRNDSILAVDVSLVPDYVFRDINLKYAFKINEKNQFFVNLYASGDRFNYQIDQEVKNRNVKKFTEERNSQLAGSFQYYNNRKKADTRITLSTSILNQFYSNQIWLDSLSVDSMKMYADKEAGNLLAEFSIKLDHTYRLSEKHLLNMGFGWVRNRSSYQEISLIQDSILFHNLGTNSFIYVEDQWILNKRLSLNTGLRTNYFRLDKKLYHDPRIQLTYDATDELRLYAAAGRFHQFVSKSTMMDSLGNFRYFWTLCEGEIVPVLSGNHLVLGGKYQWNEFAFTADFYYKRLDGLTRYFYATNAQIQDVLSIDSYTLGMDFLARRDWKGNAVWIAYTLGSVLEYKSYADFHFLGRAPHDQRQELKLAALVSFHPFYVSSNYVFGSGFPAYFAIGLDDPTPDYSRLDIALMYQFMDSRWQGEMGLSVLNVLNTSNIKYTNFERIPSDQHNTITVFTEAVPFTPNLYIKVRL